MAYQSLYRRYRPRRFGELRGQPYVVKALRNAVRDDRVGHAYLFSGPRGTGKTSTARILAKVLNCENPVDGEPCCACPSCLAVEAGTSFDVHELDAASNNGVDDIRDLIDKAMLGTPGRRKVYILDEVHMLSRAAEAALLKTLEEPPSHVVFVLATTDPEKVSATIRSRTQHLEFHLLPADELEEHVRWVIADAGLQVDEAAIEGVLRQGRGSARDTLSALDQAVAAGGVLPDGEPLDELVEALAEADTARALTAVAVAVQAGRDARTLTEHLISQLRDAFLSLMAPELVQLPPRAAAHVLDQGRRLTAPGIVRAMEVLGETLVDIRKAPDPRLLLDVALVRLTNPSTDGSWSALATRVERLERGLLPGPEHAASPAAGRAPEPASARPEPSSEAEASGATRAVLGARAKRGDEPVDPRAPTTPPASVVAATSNVDTDGSAAAAGVSRDQLTLVWADQVLPRLKPLAKALFSAGRFVEVPGGRPVLVVPNAPHRSRALEHVDAVESVLAEVLGQRFSLTLVTEAEVPQPSGHAALDESIDLDELVDAPVTSPLDRIANAFPGAQLFDED